MTIVPLPQFEEDLKAHLDEEDRRAYEALKPPRSVVVRFGALKYIGEFPYTGDARPGCGSRLVVRTFRGTEIGEMLTSTCPNSGCSKSVSRQEMLRYIENSGGRDYPFFTDGRVLRIATKEDLEVQAAIEQSRHELRLRAREIAQRLRLSCRIVDVEPILGGECITVYCCSEERVDLRDLGRELSHAFRARVELRHVGARDEARITADYEKCGQYCCCKNFLKVLKPVSMKSAKVQKATLDPLKISGRCGRLMCCLRYEDATYEELAKRLPRKKSRVGTPEGDGVVIGTQILTQLVLVELDAPDSAGKPRQIAVPVEELTPPAGQVPRPPRPPSPAPQTQPGPRPPASREAGAEPPAARRPRPAPEARSLDAEIDRLMGSIEDDIGDGPPASSAPQQPSRRKRRRKRRGRRPPDSASGSADAPQG
jgi:cell fate regulator YaaT (PSP1 superfamily)